MNPSPYCTQTHLGRAFAISVCCCWVGLFCWTVFRSFPFRCHWMHETMDCFCFRSAEADILSPSFSSINWLHYLWMEMNAIRFIFSCCFRSIYYESLQHRENVQSKHINVDDTRDNIKNTHTHSQTHWANEANGEQINNINNSFFFSLSSVVNWKWNIKKRRWQ